MKSACPFVDHDALLSPTVFVRDDVKAFLIHPGSTLPPQVLATGWQFHWPIISVIRAVNFRRLDYVIGPNPTPFGDEPVVAVSRDHHLMVVSATVKLGLDPDAGSNLSKWGRHSTDRLVRPLLRQAIRGLLSTIDHHQLTNDANLHPRLKQAIQAAGQPHGLLVSEVSEIIIEPYINQNTRSTK